MNDRQTQSLNGYRGLKGVFDNYATEIAGYNKVQEKVTAFINNMTQIEEVAKDTETNTTGVTKGKGEVKNELAVVAAELAAGVLAYAGDMGDTALQGTFDITYSDLRYAKDEDALNIAKMLLTELGALDAAKLSEYLIEAEDITELDELATRFEELSETKGSVKASSQTAHKKLNQLFKETQDLLVNQLDNLMIRLQRREPDLTEDYFNARG